MDILEQNKNRPKMKIDEILVKMNKKEIFDLQKPTIIF